MKFERLLIIGFLAQWLSLATAEQTDPDDCRNLADDADRLNCYDAAFGRDPAADVPESRSGTADQAPIKEDENSARETSASDDFGAEQVEQRVDRLEARLAGDFTGWTGSTRFRLDNGQVWQQTKNYIPDYEPREPISQPRVTITRGLMGSYNLRVEGVKRIVQVKRIE
jgi:hypothetical protein